jgi:hypothetical protein
MLFALMFLQSLSFCGKSTVLIIWFTLYYIFGYILFHYKSKLPIYLRNGITYIFFILYAIESGVWFLKSVGNDAIKFDF